MWLLLALRWLIVVCIVVVVTEGESTDQRNRQNCAVLHPMRLSEDVFVSDSPVGVETKLAGYQFVQKLLVEKIGLFGFSVEEWIDGNGDPPCRWQVASLSPSQSVIREVRQIAFENRVQPTDRDDLAGRGLAVIFDADVYRKWLANFRETRNGINVVDSHPGALVQLRSALGAIYSILGRLRARAKITTPIPRRNSNSSRAFVEPPDSIIPQRALSSVFGGFRRYVNGFVGVVQDGGLKKHAASRKNDKKESGYLSPFLSALVAFILFTSSVAVLSYGVLKSRNTFGYLSCLFGAIAFIYASGRLFLVGAAGWHLGL